MAAPWSPMLRTKTRAMTADASGGGAQAHVNISTKVRRNSLVSDPEDMVLLREKLTKIAVGRVHGISDDISAHRDDSAGHRRSSSGGATPMTEHFKVFPLQPPERPSTPPSSPQPRDVLRKQLRLKQNLAAKTRRQRAGSSSVAVSDEENDGDGEETLEPMLSVDEVEIAPMDMDDDVMASHAIPSPPRGQRLPQARLSIPSHLRVMSSFSVLNKYPEGLRKRKSVHVEDACGCDGPGSRASLKKTSSQVNIMGASGLTAGLPRSNSAGGEVFQSFAPSAAPRRREQQQQDQEMEDVCVSSSKPQSTPQNPLFASTRLEEHGRLSACS